MYQALVIARQGKTFLVQDQQGQQHLCNVRTQAIDAVCGDQVECASHSQSHDVIEKICPRKNQITRIDNFKREKTLAANIDHMIIVIAASPAFTRVLIDKYLTCAQLNQCKTTLVINKAEKLNYYNVDINAIETIYRPLVDNFIITSAKLGYGIQALRNVMANENSILVGQSGTGKSSLINRLLRSNLIRVGKLSDNIQQGKHTTSNAYAHNINQHGKIIDSPGVRTFMPIFKDTQEIMLGFKEFLPHINHCKFNNCQHINEPKCAIQSEVDKGHIQISRYQSYLKITQQLQLQ